MLARYGARAPTGDNFDGSLAAVGVKKLQIEAAPEFGRAQRHPALWSGIGTQAIERMREGSGGLTLLKRLFVRKVVVRR
jgi:hypothetical protein